MNEFQKSLTRFMYVALICVVGISAFALTRPGKPIGGLADTNRGITATGTCVVRTKPDLAEITIGVRQSNRSARYANDYVRTHTRKVIAALRKQGIAQKDIQTEHFGLSPSWDAHKHFVTWSCSENLRVKIRDVGSVAKIVDEVVQAGANQIHDIRYTVDDVSALRAKGRVKAAKVARDKASMLASSLGGKLGKLKSVSEHYPGDYDYGYYGRRYGGSNAQVSVDFPSGADTACEEITIQPGEMALTVVVSATYELM